MRSEALLLVPYLMRAPVQMVSDGVHVQNDITRYLQIQPVCSAS